MNDREFTTYDQASELLELGFRFYEDGLYMKCHAEAWGFSLSHEQNLPIPLYSQAFKWFRESHLLFPTIKVDQTTEPKFCYSISKYENTQFFEGWQELVFNSELFYTYEEAENECLNKLIDIVKSYDHSL